MEIFARIAEQRILEAMERGGFENLPGKGRPLRMDDDSIVPDELRVAYKLLKNAGCIPPELELHKEVMNLKDLLNTVDDGEERGRRLKELNFKLLRLNMMRKTPLNLDLFPEYKERVEGKLVGL
jgi:hypothetical protein